MNLDIILSCLVLQKHFQEGIVLLICDSKSNTQRDLEDLQQVKNQHQGIGKREVVKF